MAWTTPKTDWATSDGILNSDLNRIEGNTLDNYNNVTKANTYNSIGVIQFNRNIGYASIPAASNATLDRYYISVPDNTLLKVRLIAARVQGTHSGVSVRLWDSANLGLRWERTVSSGDYYGDANHTLYFNSSGSTSNRSIYLDVANSDVSPQTMTSDSTIHFHLTGFLNYYT